VTDPSKVVARNRVTVVLDGCAVREVYEQDDGRVGESLSIYDASRRGWHQSWVTNRGGLLLLSGGLESERMVLTGPDRAADGGKTWTPVFDIVFRPHRQPRESPGALASPRVNSARRGHDSGYAPFARSG
jgi:hypothetical protein